MVNHPNRNRKYRVVADSMAMTYSSHATEQAAIKAAKALARKWGWSHPGTEPRVQHLTETGWRTIASFTTA